MALQKARLAELKSPLGPDKLLVQSFHGTEQLGRLFSYELDLLSEDDAVKLDDILGQNVTLRLDVGGDGTRFFNGFVTRFVQAGHAANLVHYQAVVRPWLWFLSQRSDCRIFQEMTVPEIVKEVCKGAGFTDVKESLSGSYEKWGYCVQYRETDFNFVSRLLEQEGIYYFFAHEDGKHTLVLADAPGAHEAAKGYEAVPFHPHSDASTRDREFVYAWALEREVVPGKYVLTDFDFEAPSADLMVEKSASRSYAHADIEVFDFPGEYAQGEDGAGWAKSRLEELQWQFEQVRGVSNARGLAAGGIFELEEHPRSDQNREYLIVGTSLKVRTAEFESGDGGEGPAVTCAFRAIESKTPYRSPRITPKPSIQGPQTAIVVGPSGDEIYTDKYGRVKAQFHWDRYGKKDENSSCWIRVAQLWAGGTWGSIHIPRIGQEVMVEFLDGDPDRPIVTGRVYNGEQMPPYSLPGNMTQSGVKSRSTKGGSSDDFNELRFEDKAGDEQIYFHAQKNYDQIVENDRTEDVGHDRSLHVGNDKHEKVDANKTIEIGVDHTEKIGANKSLTVGANHDETIGGSMFVNVSAALTETVGGAYAETVGGAMTVTVGGAYALTAGAAMAETVGAAKSVTIGNTLSENVGKGMTVDVGEDLKETIGKNRNMQVEEDFNENVGKNHNHNVTETYTLQAKKVHIVAEDEISLKAGGAVITLKKSGDISVKGSGKIEIKADKDIILKGSKISEN